ncbi:MULTISPECIES: glutathione transferase [unclassified Pseudomonas]|uniref:glutathione transferase n=1 Tax=unclassified Pseudomonas TaxID=196821 RepID=UPI000C86C845|nr:MULTISPECIES: glutathione transferase [unclassified Pseudomonas]PMV18297.1 glutathione S-transferase [Pseudomonas sp. FW305-3-2-15-C-TSA2]PMV28761.1 glutathione S-transferase [Pseudomonas sp. DP16D-L5]PMV36549.1 glutathione S-transferase [Pseudomonas sp. FW305-3-2-15-A-LB2]PMV48964.1 glutathione S-transferase [Pseudomonas sp. FW305-3-2-15-C-R2A1]PMV53420.1 glutathione S-transferase [Pseudomonas sp. FW305-3-2-15-C-LB1]
MRLYVDHLYTSPYAMSVFVTLREKGLAFDTVTLDLDAAQQHAADFAQLSLTQRVPTLLEGDFALSESSAITEYLEQAYPEAPVYPADPKQRARARQVQAWLRSDLLPIRQERSTMVVFYGQKMPALSPVAQAAATKLISAAQALLAGNPPYLFGEWCIADVDLAVMLNRLILNGDSVPAELVAYARRQWQRPSVQAWVQQQRPAQ